MSLCWLIAITFTLFIVLVYALPPDQIPNKRDDNPRLETQYKDPEVLAGISRDKSKKAEFSPAYKYYYNPSTGEGSISQLIDTGFDTKTPEYKSWNPKPRQIIVEKDLPNDATTEKDDPQGHRTYVGSLLSSPKYGVSKKSSIVIVKTPLLATDAITLCYIDNCIATLQAVADDLESVLKDRLDLKGKLFVSFSSGFTTQAAKIISDQKIKSIKKAFKAINRLAMIYTTTGNQRPKQKRRGSFSKETEYLER